MTEHTVIRDDVTLVCHDRGGDGPPLLLLHGLAGYGGEWDTLARHLGPRFRVVTVDQRGHGASTRRPADVSRAAHVADVVAVIEQLDLGPVTLLGQSYGGHAAMLAAAAHPELVERLVMVEAGPAAGSAETVADIGAWFASWPTPFATAPAAVEFLGGGPVGEAWAAGPRCGGDGCGAVVLREKSTSATSCAVDTSQPCGYRSCCGAVRSRVCRWPSRGKSGGVAGRTRSKAYRLFSATRQEAVLSTWCSSSSRWSPPGPRVSKAQSVSASSARGATLRPRAGAAVQ